MRLCGGDGSIVGGGGAIVPLFGRGSWENCPPATQFEYNSDDGPKLDKFGNTVAEDDDDEDEGETSLLTEDPNINYRDVEDDGMDVEDDGVRHCKSDPWRRGWQTNRTTTLSSGLGGGQRRCGDANKSLSDCNQ
jgi:hypothetical protein